MDTSYAAYIIGAALVIAAAVLFLVLRSRGR
jgi:hypothetical protein